MLKKYSPIDLLFFVLSAIFIALSSYELIQYILPRYTYPRAIGVFVIMFLVYFGYNLFLEKISKISSENNFDTSEKLRKYPVNPLLKYSLILYKLSKKYIQVLVYGGFILVALAIHLGQVYDITVFTVYLIVGFVALYIYAKILGFNLDMRVKKSSLRAFNTLRFFIILYAIFFVIVNYLLDTFQVPEGEKIPIYLGASAVYLVSGFFIFFDCKSLLFPLTGYATQKLLRPYPIFMTILILGLSGYLVAKNNLIEQINEGSDLAGQNSKQSAGGVVLPEVISSQLNLENPEPEQESIEYQTVLVSEQYDIEPGLALGSSGESVALLQRVLGNLQYFLGEVNGEFGEDTQSALIEALQTECAWPDTTRGIFGPQAKACIDNLEISIRLQQEEIEEIISDEVTING